MVYYIAKALETTKFHVLVTTLLLSYKYTAKVHCYKLPLIPNHLCKAICDAGLGYSRDCKQIFKNCDFKDEDDYVSGTNHGICKTLCGRRYTTCSYVCLNIYHEDELYQLCSELCKIWCSHS